MAWEQGDILEYPENSIDDITRSRIVDCALKINNLENIIFADATLLMFHSQPFHLKGMIEFNRKTMELNHLIRIRLGLDK